MERESADDASQPDVLASALAERDRLRTALDAADAVIAGLRRDAQAGSQAKADFMARMTHELRTPLSAIIGLADLAQVGAIPSDTRDYLTKIRTSARTLLGVVDDITDFSRLEKGLADPVSVPFSPGNLLSRLAARFIEAAHHKGLSLVTRLDPAIPERLEGDRNRIEQILGHLVGNAVKFTEHGQVTVSLVLVEHRETRVVLEFSVRDTGIGMAPETIPAMLESFTQADGSLSRPYGGTGLGLAIVQRGVHLLGGSLEAASQPGQGTLFSFRLPLDEASRAACANPAGGGQACPAPAQDPAGPPLAGARVLLVEDNAINQQVARENLRRFGATVDVAGHGGEAVDMVRLRPYDVVLMDVQMPVMDGLTATRRIRALPGLAELPIVALTAHALAEDRDRCLAAGMNDYLTKPIDPDRLLATLGQWIDPTGEALRAGETAPAASVIAPHAPPATPVPPASAQGLDVATALARLGGNERLLRSVAAEFARDYADCAAQLRREVTAGNLDAARRLAHTVKGVAGNIAAEPLAQAARELEALLATGGTPPEALLAAFAVALDLTLAAASRLAPPEAPAPVRPNGPHWHFLLVDDARLNRAIFTQILTSAGHGVVAANNGKEACRLLFGEKRRGPGFDGIIMDIEMPEMDGLRAARLIRSLLSASASPPCPPDLPIVALTSHEPETERERCRQAGMDACLPKIFDRDELLAAIGQVMAGKGAKPHAPVRERPRTRAASILPVLTRGLARHLSEGSIQADEDLAALREALADRFEPPDLASLTAAIERYDFAGALESLGRLAEALGLAPADAAPPVGSVLREAGGKSR